MRRKSNGIFDFRLTFLWRSIVCDQGGKSCSKAGLFVFQKEKDFFAGYKVPKIWVEREV